MKHSKKDKNRRAANKEALSSEERLQRLQSANKELRTAKEELQASYEEITILNGKLNSRNAQLSQCNDDLNNLLNSLQIPVVIIDNDLRIRRFTPSAELLFKLNPTDIGRSINDIKSRVGIADIKEPILRVLQDMSVVEQEVQDETGRWWSLHIKPYRTGGDKIDGVTIAFLDIDTLKQNEFLLKAYIALRNSIIQNIRIPLLVLDRNMRVKMANQFFYKMFQASPGETENPSIDLLGDGHWNIPELRKMLEAVVSQKMSVTGYELEKYFPRLGHKSLLLNAQSLPAKDNEEPLILLSIEDVTERKRAENEMIDNAKALKAHSEELQRSNVELQQFASTASHDLQAPFMLISNFLGILESNYKDKLDGKAQELVDLARDGALRAQALIQKLLQYARLDAELKFEIVPMKIVLSEVKTILQLPIEKEDVTITVDDLPRIQADRVLMLLLMQNLITNCIKYRSHKPLKIHIGVEKKSDDWIFSVTDNGMGMDAQHKDRVFNMFERLHPQKQDGAGIGLAICRKIVELHGGHIWVESETDNGATFLFSIPEHPKQRCS